MLSHTGPVTITHAKVLVKQCTWWERLLGRKDQYDDVRLTTAPSQDQTTIVYVNGLLRGEYREYS